MTFKRLGLLLTSVLVALIFALPVSTADAGRRYRGTNGLDKGYVTAYSRYFPDTKITAPVRPSRLGPQVRLPSGHWTYCRTSCSETLRVRTIDENANYNNGLHNGAGLHNECGIFGCLELYLRR